MYSSIIITSKVQHLIYFDLKPRSTLDKIASKFFGIDSDYDVPDPLKSNMIIREQ